MFGLLSGMFTSNNIDRAGEGLYNGIDNMFYTDEEKGVANQKILDWKLKYASVTAPQNISRRFIAIVVTLLWALAIVVMCVAKFFDNATFATYMFEVMRDVVGPPFMIIVGFYFLAHITKGLGSSKTDS